MRTRTRAERAPNRRWSVPVLRIAGVTVRVHVTFLALVALVALTAEDAGGTAIAAVGWLLALFACVVAHEFAHALVARSKGVAVHEIDLLPIGGVSRLERIPERWRDEAAIAAAGPMASLGVALVAFLFAATASQPLWPAALWDGPLLVRLGWVNVMLAGFNVLPAFPLDGGRVLRAVLERDRSRVEATRQAARVGRGLAAAMIGVGLVANLWLMVIGLFVIAAGRAEEATVLIHEALGPTPARALAVPCPVVLRAEMTAGEALRVSRAAYQPAYPVIDVDGHVVGLVSAGGLRRAGPTAPVAELAAGSTVEGQASLEDIAELISRGPVAVTSDGVLLGIITQSTFNDHVRRRLPEVTA